VDPDVALGVVDRVLGAGLEGAHPVKDLEGLPGERSVKLWRSQQGEERGHGVTLDEREPET
jgi:hypothetical protein